MQVVYERCAGVDVHKRTVVVTVLLTHEERVEKQTRTFGTMTDDLLAFARVARHPRGHAGGDGIDRCLLVAGLQPVGRRPHHRAGQPAPYQGRARTQDGRESVLGGWPTCCAMAC